MPRARLSGDLVFDIRDDGRAVGIDLREDWAAALVGLNITDLHDAPEVVHDTLMCLLKTREDSGRITREVTSRILGKVA